MCPLLGRVLESDCHVCCISRATTVFFFVRGGTVSPLAERGERRLLRGCAGVHTYELFVCYNALRIVLGPSSKSMVL